MTKYVVCIDLSRFWNLSSKILFVTFARNLNIYIGKYKFYVIRIFYFYYREYDFLFVYFYNFDFVLKVESFFEFCVCYVDI